MTPAQRIMLEARQSAQRVGHLAAWLRQHRRLVGVAELGLKATLEGASARLDDIQSAVDAPPCIGIIGEAGSGKSELVTAMTMPAEALTGERGQSIDGSVVRGILVGEGGRGCCAALRFRHAGGHNVPRDFPFRIGLLGLADVAVIMVRMARTWLPSRLTPPPSLERLARLYDDVSGNLLPGSVSAFTVRDVHTLRDTLQSLFPDDDGLRLLAAAGYWDDLAEVASHLPEAELRRVLSLLWGEQADLTWLFCHLGEAIAQLSYATEAFCPREALVERDPKSGWITRHSESIIDSATLARLGDERDQTLRVVGRYGHTATVTRSSLAALVADLSVAIATAPIAALRSTDLIEFPSTLPLDGLEFAEESVAKPLSRTVLAAVFASAKATHLFERACQRHEVTSLVVCVDPRAEPSETLPASIGDWIALTHGTEPTEREQARAGLILVATDRPASAAESAAQTAARHAERASWAPRIAEAVAGDQIWLDEWTPSRPFANIHIVERPPAGAAARTGPGALAARKLNSDALSRGEEPLAARREIATVRALAPIAGKGFCSELTRAAQHHGRTSLNGAERVLMNLTPVSQPVVKERQLKRQLAETHRGLRARLMRYHADGELAEIEEWRRRVAAMVEHRLGSVCRRGGLGRLLAALTVSEAELTAVYRRHQRRGWTTRIDVPHDYPIDLDAGHVSSGAPRGIAVPAHRRARFIILAEAAVGHWLATGRAAARSSRLCRDIGLSGNIIEHIVDEIGMAAVRLALPRRVAETLIQSIGERPDDERVFAACAGAIINGFVEHLTLETSTTSHDTASNGLHDTLDGVGRRSGSRSWRPGAVSLSERWCGAFSSMIDANIASANFMAEGEANSDLARLLAQFRSSNLEVEL